MFTKRLNSFLWSSLSRLRNQHTVRVTMKGTLPKMALPTTIGFSIFTWLGFNQPNMPEDELITSIKYSILFIQRQEFDKAERLLHVALRQAQQLQHKFGITYIYDVMANLALERNQLEKAKKLFLSVAQRLMADGATEDDLRVIQISIKLARISHLQREMEVARIGYDWCMKKLQSAVSMEPTSANFQLVAITEDWYGRFLIDINDYEEGLTLMKNALERMKAIESVDLEHIVVQLNDIGTVCEKINKLDESLEYFKKAIESGSKIDGMDDLGIMYVNMGRVYIKKNMLTEARKNCGYGWRLGQDNKKEEIKNEAVACIKEINSLS